MMKSTSRYSRSLILGLALAVVLGCAPEQPSEVADRVYTNGKIYTMSESQPWAEAVAIRDILQSVNITVEDAKNSSQWRWGS